MCCTMAKNRYSFFRHIDIKKLKEKVEHPFKKKCKKTKTFFNKNISYINLTFQIITLNKIPKCQINQKENNYKKA